MREPLIPEPLLPLLFDIATVTYCYYHFYINAIITISLILPLNHLVSKLWQILRPSAAESPEVADLQRLHAQPSLMLVQGVSGLGLCLGLGSSTGWSFDGI